KRYLRMSHFYTASFIVSVFVRHLYHEASAGTLKLVNIPWGFHNRLFRVTVPPGTLEGSKLRLKGQGKQMESHRRGDLYLKVFIKS
ncbi:MAG TPA: DnaJ C-terminal domain-containing protein, partial [Desulfobacterales bacterium]|nr:DnaJ C-terminal domain-containing protein [Desulfobacterales bacterium]